MLDLLIINLLLSLFWPVLNADFSLAQLLIGFALGFVVISLTERRYGRFGIRLVSFIFYVLYQILESAVRFAWLVIRMVFRPATPIHPGIVGVPLDITNNFDKMLLASITTLTPGSVVIDLRRSDDGRELMYIHGIDVADPIAFQNEVKSKFERPILRIREDLEER